MFKYYVFTYVCSSTEGSKTPPLKGFLYNLTMHYPFSGIYSFFTIIIFLLILFYYNFILELNRFMPPKIHRGGCVTVSLSKLWHWSHKMCEVTRTTRESSGNKTLPPHEDHCNQSRPFIEFQGDPATYLQPDPKLYIVLYKA